MIIPDAMPRSSAPSMPFLRVVNIGLLKKRGRGIKKTSSMERPMRMKIFATTRFVHGLVWMVPKKLPVSPAMLPKTIYVSDVPSTYTNERRKPFIRDPLPWDPMKETVMGMRGYMHGVKLTRTPPIYEERRARSIDP